MMNTSPFHTTSQETEVLLRTTLSEHAPQTVDLEQGWAVVSRQILSLDSKVPSGTGVRSVTSENTRRLPSRNRWSLAMVAALLIALLGAGIAGPFAHWFSSSTSAPIAYAAINQSMQVADGIQLTATKGYADPKHLILYYDVHLPSNLGGKYHGAFVVKSTIQGKNARGVCESVSKASNPVLHCVIIFPFGRESVGDTLRVTWQVSEVELVPFAAPNTSIIFLQGDWTLQFSLPFHHEVHDPTITLPDN